MNSLFFIAKNNIKKHKGEAAIIFALIFIAALLLFSSLSLMLSGSNTIRDCDEKYHIADLMAMSAGLGTDDMKEKIKGLDNMERYEIVPCIESPSDYYYSDMAKEDAISYIFYMYDSSRPTYLNAFPEEFNDLKDDEIVLPYYMSYQISKGDLIHVSAAGKDYTFKVKGFAENLYFATAMNLSGLYTLVSHDMFEEIWKNTDDMSRMSVGMFKVKPGADLHGFDMEVQKALTGSSPLTIDRPTMNMATTGITNIATSIVFIFTVILVVMAVIIMHFSIRNFIELNVQNIGLLQATGYTSKELRAACIIEQMIICIFATAAAVAAGIFLAKPLAALSGMMMGLSGFTGISVPALISTAAGIPAMVFIGALIATSSYRKLTVLEALKSGITSHNFKKNHFPLETSKLPLSLAMAGKNIFGSGKKSVLISLIVAGLTLSTCLGFTLFQNWALDQAALLKLVGFESSDIQVTVIGDEEYVEKMRKDPAVRMVNTWTTLSSMEVTHLDKSTSLGIDVYGDVSKLKNEYILEGHAPKNDKEIVLSTVEADNIGAKVGDKVNIKTVSGKGTVAYTVSGIDQKINNMGKKAVMTEEGAKRLDPDYKFLNVLIYLNEPSRAKQLKKEWEKEYPDYQFTLVEDLIGSTINTITQAMEAICVIFIIATCFVVILTQVLLTRAQIIRERTDLGVSKALGYTSGELMRRTLMTNIPTIAIGMVLGIVMHVLFTNRLILIGLSTFGIKQNSFKTSPVWIALTALMILVCAVVSAFFSGKGITKLEPVKILKEE